MDRLTVAGREVRALLLDLDGTLVDSEPVHRETYRRFFAARGWDADDDLLHLFTGRRADDVFAATDGPWRDEDPLELFHEVVTHTPTDVLPVAMGGATDLLDAAEAARVPVALVTSAGRAWAETALPVVGGVGRFTTLVTREEVERGKPHPDGYTLAMRRLDVEPGLCLAAEDTAAGIEAARAAGAGIVVGVTSTFTAEELTRAGADIVGPDLGGLLAAPRP